MRACKVGTSNSRVQEQASTHSGRVASKRAHSSSTNTGAGRIASSSSLIAGTKRSPTAQVQAEV